MVKRCGKVSESDNSLFSRRDYSYIFALPDGMSSNDQTKIDLTISARFGLGCVGSRSDAGVILRCVGQP